MFISHPCIFLKVKVKSLSHVQLFATPWTVAYQASPSMGFSRQEYWTRLPFPSPGIFPTQGSNPGLLHCRQTLYLLRYLPWRNAFNYLFNTELTETQILYDKYDFIIKISANILSQSFNFLHGVLWNLSIFCIVAFAVIIVFEKLLPSQRLQRVLLCFLLKVLVLSLTFSSVSHFELTFVHNVN